MNEQQKRMTWSEETGYPKAVTNYNLTCANCIYRDPRPNVVAWCSQYPSMKPSGVLYGTEECPKKKTRS